jgi:hypothetical protein
MVADIGHYWIDKQGYARFGNDTHIHRHVMEHMLGRKLVGEECVHHKNRNKLDNRRENLQLCANDAEHRFIHMVEDYQLDGVDYKTHLWCSYHQEYHPRTEFSTNKLHWSGLHNNCRKATNEYRKLKGLNCGKFNWKERLNQQYRRAKTKNTQISWLGQEGTGQ